MHNKKRRLTITYLVKNQDGAVVASNEKDGELISYTEGAEEIVRGLEVFLMDKEKGFCGTVTVAAEDAFGIHDPETVIVAQPHHFDDSDVKVGDEVMGSDEYEGIVFRVVKMDSEGVTLDANHPLAGMDLTYEVEVIQVQEVLV